MKLTEKKVTYLIPFPDQGFSAEMSSDLSDLSVAVQEVFTFRITNPKQSPGSSVLADPLDREENTSC